MTSKEALELLKHSLNYYSLNGQIKELKDTAYSINLEIIERDLEVLEIFKKLNFKVYQNGGGYQWNWFIDTEYSQPITRYEAKKIEDWKKD